MNLESLEKTLEAFAVQLQWGSRGCCFTLIVSQFCRKISYLLYYLVGNHKLQLNKIIKVNFSLSQQKASSKQNGYRPPAWGRSRLPSRLAWR